MTTRTRRPARAAVALAAVVLALLLSGCVYLRLLQLKHQLGDFDRNFAVQTREGLRLECLQPVLLADDLRFLGFYPATIKTLGVAEQWRIRWVKQMPAGGGERGHYDIAFDLFFTAGKLNAVHIPENYFAFMPKEVVVAGLKSLGGAKVDKSSRSIETNVLTQLREHIIPPSAKGVSEMLGRPTERAVVGNRETLRYHFVSADPEARGKDFDLALVFDARTGDLRETRGKLPVGNLHLKFDPPAGAPPL
jgi:hypothetical protein